MKIKESISRFRPYLLGFISGMFISILLVGLNAMKEPRVEYLAPPPFTESSATMTGLQSYGEGIITNRSDRYFYRGLDWIIIKDFPDHIDSYEGIFEGVSEVLWS